MIKAAVLGKPVSHSLSPYIFNGIANGLNIDFHYSRVTTDDFTKALNLCNKLNLFGINITSPYKSDSAKESDLKTLEVRETNAANILIFNDIIKSFNSDYHALFSILSDRFISRSSKALVIGSGSTAMTALCALKNYGINNITLTARKSATMIFGFNCNLCNFISIDEINSLETYELIINTIPENDYIKPNMFCKKNQVLIDTLYHNTYLESVACHYISGREWLVRQSIPFLEMIFANKFEFDSLFPFIENIGKNLKKIAMVGFSGSGKSTLAGIISEKLNFEFIDIDEEIENVTGMNISKIFTQYGESEFRNIEKNIIFNLRISKPTIVAFGGGSIQNVELLDYIKKNYYVIYIYNDLATSMSRITGLENRPMLSLYDADELYSSRLDNYYKSSDLIIDNTGDLKQVSNLLEYEIRNII